MEENNPFNVLAAQEETERFRKALQEIARHKPNESRAGANDNYYKVKLMASIANNALAGTGTNAEELAGIQIHLKLNHGDHPPCPRCKAPNAMRDCTVLGPGGKHTGMYQCCRCNHRVETS